MRPSHAWPTGSAAFQVEVQLTLNGQQFLTSPLTFEYNEAPSVSRILPPAGPQAGGVIVHVYGANLRPGHAISGSHLPPLSCAFGDTVVPGTFVNGTDGTHAVRCISPMRTPGEVSLEIVHGAGNT